MPEPDFNIPTVYSDDIFGNFSLPIQTRSQPASSNFSIPISEREKATGSGFISSVFSKFGLGPTAAAVTGDRFAQKSAAAAGYPVQVNTANIDPGAAALGALSGITGALMNRIGATGDEVTFERVASTDSGGSGGGFADDPMLLLLGAGAVITVLYFAMRD